MGFYKAEGLLKTTITRGKEVTVVCRVFPLDITFTYPKAASVPFAVVKEAGKGSAVLVFDEDGTAWTKKYTLTSEQLSVVSSHKCGIFLNRHNAHAW